MDIQEAKFFAYCIHICDCCRFKRRVDADLGFASLMAFHAARFVTKIRELNARGHDHTGLADCAAVVARNAVHDGAERMGRVNDVDFAAIRTDIILVSCAAVTLCTFHGNFSRIFLIPVVECFRGGVGVGRPHPLAQERHCTREGHSRLRCVLRQRYACPQEERKRDHTYQTCEE